MANSGSGESVVERVVRILATFDSDRRAQTPTAIARRAGLPTSDLLTKEGGSKLIETCTYPLTGIGCVTRVYTDHAVFEVGASGARVLDRFGTTLEQLRGLTGSPSTGREACRAGSAIRRRQVRPTSTAPRSRCTAD